MQHGSVHGGSFRQREEPHSSIWWHCTPYHNTGWVFHSCNCIPTCTDRSTNLLFTYVELLDCWFIREKNFYPLLFTPISRFIRKYHSFSLHSLSQSWFFHWFMRFETKFVHQTSTYSGAMNIRTFQNQRWPYLLTRTRRRANHNSLNQMVITWGSFPCRPLLFLSTYEPQILNFTIAWCTAVLLHSTFSLIKRSDSPSLCKITIWACFTSLREAFFTHF